MMYPILCKIQFETLHRLFRNRDIWIQLAFSVFLNWIIAPFLMVGRLEDPLKPKHLWGNSLICGSWHWRGRFCPMTLVFEKA